MLLVMFQQMLFRNRQIAAVIAEFLGRLPQTMTGNRLFRPRRSQWTTGTSILRETAALKLSFLLLDQPGPCSLPAPHYQQLRHAQHILFGRRPIEGVNLSKEELHPSCLMFFPEISHSHRMEPCWKFNCKTTVRRLGMVTAKTHKKLEEMQGVITRRYIP